MVIGKNISAKEFADGIIKKMQLSPQQLDLARAIYTGDKCKDLKPEEIKKHTDAMVGKVMIYFGNFDFNTEAGRHYHQYKTLCDTSPREFTNEYPNLTIQEIIYSIQKGIRKYWGNYDTWNVSLKLFNELIVQYQASDQRRIVVKKYIHTKDDLSITQITLSDAEIEAASFKHYANQFEKFKTHGINSVFISHRDYDWLIEKCALPDHQEFHVEASKIVSKKLKNQVKISDIIDRITHNKILFEAKRLAVIKFYSKLISHDISIINYIQNPFEI